MTLPGYGSRYSQVLAESKEHLYSSETQFVGEVGVVSVSGEMDLCTANRFRQDIDEAVERTSGDLVLDLARVDMIDSTALGVLLRVQSRLNEDGRSLILVSRAHVMRILTITGLTTTFRLAASVAEAIGQSPGRVDARRAA